MSAGSGVLGEVARPRVGAWVAAAAYVLVLAVCAAMSLAGLVVGAVVGAAAHVPAVGAVVAGAAANGDSWARGVLAAVPLSEPAAQAVLDYGFSLLSLALASALLVVARGSWPSRLLALALTAAAGAFNLQALAGTTAVQTATGLALGEVQQVFLYGVTFVAYIVALLAFPAESDVRPAELGRPLVVAAGAGVVLAVGIGTALLPRTTSGVLLFGFLVPLAGLAVLPRKIREGATDAARTQARLLFSALAAVLAIAVVLAITTLLVWSTGWTGLVLMDPTAGGADGSEPTALLFWFSRFAGIGVASAVLVAMRAGGLWTSERLFSRGLVAALVAALVGGAYLLVRITVGSSLDDSTPQGALAAGAAATAVAAVLFLPVYVYAERVVDRLLYGSRPTPYSVLAGIAEMSRRTAPDAPDLARLAEAVGRGLGATTCRLTVVRKGLRDRTYTWTERGANVSEELVEVPVRHGAERIGAIAVDRAAVAGLHRQRQNLLEDIAVSLGVVVQASRVGIELERQLRAAVAHANEIAVSRRAVVAEMDAERRRIERDLHDGAQHHLVSLRLTLGLVEHQVSTAQFAEARERLAQVADGIQTAEAILAETAAGVSSPMLAELGLVRALEKELSAGPEPVRLEADQAVATPGRVPVDVESAVYFCCLEAVNNARKHAPGATIAVRLLVEQGRLCFAVVDDGPGWDPALSAGTPGRGMRNVRARIAAVGGRIDVRSSRGAGTTVEGSAPLPSAAEAPTVKTPRVEAAPAAPVPTTVAPDGLTERVRRAVRTAREHYDGTPHAPAVLELAARLDQPMRIAVTGAPGSGAEILAEGLEGVAGSVRIAIADPVADPRAGALEPTVADAFVVLMRHGHAEDLARIAAVHGRHRSALAIGVLVVDRSAVPDPDRAAEELAAHPDVRRVCATVVPVDPQLVRAAATLTDGDVQGLRRWAEQRPDVPPPTDADGRNGGAALVAAGSGTGVSELRAGSAGRAEPAAATVPLVAVGRIGAGGLRFAAELVGSGQATDAAALAEALRRHSGLSPLREHVGARFARRAESLRARSVLLALEQLVRTTPAPAGRRELLYELDRIRSGAHELAEIDTVDALLARALDVPDEDRDMAVRLLGGAGSAPAVRLGLAPHASAADVAASAAEEQARWRRRALHPTATADLRAVSDVVVHTCERLRADAAGD